jgi:GTPase SAR1 family protein
MKAVEQNTLKRPIRLAIIGDVEVGKSAMTQQYINSLFMQHNGKVYGPYLLLRDVDLRLADRGGFEFYCHLPY